MFLNHPWRGHVFIDIDNISVGWCCPSNFLILQHDYIQNRWHDLWSHIKTKSQSSEAISPLFYHNSLTGPEWSVDLDLEVGSSQIKGGNVAPLLSPFLQFLGTNIRISRIHINKVIQFSVVHVSLSPYSLALLPSKESVLEAASAPPLGTTQARCSQSRAAIHFDIHSWYALELGTLRFQFQWRRHSATYPLLHCSPYAPTQVESCTEVRFVYYNGSNVGHVLSCKAHLTWATYMDSSQLRNYIDS